MQGNFVVENYPVAIHFTDLVIVLFTVISVGVIVSWYPSKYLTKRLLNT